MKNTTKLATLTAITAAAVITLTGCSSNSSTETTMETTAETTQGTTTPSTQEQPQPQPTAPQETLPDNPLDNLTLPDKTVKKGDTFTITFTPTGTEKASTSVSIDDITLIEVNPDLSDPAKGILGFTALKTGTTKIGVTEVTENGEFNENWEGYNLTITK